MKDSFGSRLRYYRTVLDLTQQQLADKSGVSRKQISDLEKEIQNNPRPQTVLKLSKALNIAPIDLLSEVKELSFEEFKKQNRPNEVMVKLPVEIIDEIKEIAKTNNRSFEDEFDYLIHTLIIEDIQRKKLEQFNQQNDNQ